MDSQDGRAWGPAWSPSGVAPALVRSKRVKPAREGGAEMVGSFLCGHRHPRARVRCHVAVARRVASNPSFPQQALPRPTSCESVSSERP